MTELFSELKALKDDLHRHPELAFAERRTTALLKEKLAALGLAPIDLGLETGGAYLLTAGSPGPLVALRADIDAISQQEPDTPGASEIPGVMHACGHDFHTAALYGAAKLLADRKETLRGSVVFLFQPAEEITQGAQAMLDHGVWRKLPQMPAALFGLHNRPELPTGQIAVIQGPIMAGKSHFTIQLHGTAGHGGEPHKYADVMVAGAAVVTALQTVVSRNTDPLESLVCAVCSMHGGSEENFVPDTLKITGAIRALSLSVHQAAEARVAQLAESVAAAYGCTARSTFLPVVPPTINSPQMAAIARRAAGDVAGPANIVSPPPAMASEDFSLLGRDVPSFFYWLGTGGPAGNAPCWHHPRFSTDDAALPLAAALLARSAETAMEEFSL